jgi:rare lipoprotein A
MRFGKFLQRTERSLYGGLPVFLIALAFVMQGCDKKTPSPPPGYPKPYRVFNEWYQPLPDSKGFRQKGIASWYGKDFHGKRTSNGEIYDMYAMTAAHKTLPLGTLVRVKNLENQREIDLRINDRGPFVRGRIIDLSYNAAKHLDIVRRGTAPVEVVALGVQSSRGSKKGTTAPASYYSGNFTVQVGSFKDRQNAERLKRQLQKKYGHTRIVPFSNGRETYFRVWVGKYRSLSKTEAVEQDLIQNGYSNAFPLAE